MLLPFSIFGGNQQEFGPCTRQSGPNPVPKTGTSRAHSRNPPFTKPPFCFVLRDATLTTSLPCDRQCLHCKFQKQSCIFESTVKFPVSTLVGVFVGTLWCVFKQEASTFVNNIFVYTPLRIFVSTFEFVSRANRFAFEQFARIVSNLQFAISFISPTRDLQRRGFSSGTLKRFARIRRFARICESGRLSTKAWFS